MQVATLRPDSKKRTNRWSKTTKKGKGNNGATVRGRRDDDRMIGKETTQSWTSYPQAWGGTRPTSCTRARQLVMAARRLRPAGQMSGGPRRHPETRRLFSFLLVENKSRHRRRRGRACSAGVWRQDDCRAGGVGVVVARWVVSTRILDTIRIEYGSGMPQPGPAT